MMSRRCVKRERPREYASGTRSAESASRKRPRHMAEQKLDRKGKQQVDGRTAKDGRREEIGRGRMWVNNLGGLGLVDFQTCIHADGEFGWLE